MKGVNKCIIMGNLGQDPDTRYTQQGSAVSNLSIATDESYKDKQTGQMVPKTEWHRVILFNRLAEVAKDYLKKGSKVYIEGKLQTRKWQDQNGQDRYSTEIVAFDMQMLDSRQAGQQAMAPQYNSQQSPAPQNSAPQQRGYQDMPNHPNGAPQSPTPVPPAPQAQVPQQNMQAPVDDFSDDFTF